MPTSIQVQALIWLFLPHFCHSYIKILQTLAKNMENFSPLLGVVAKHPNAGQNIQQAPENWTFLFLLSGTLGIGWEKFSFQMVP